MPAILAVSLGIATTASACEPVLPFVKMLGGPALLMNSVVGLVAAVLFKALAFGWFQKSLSFARGTAYMLAGNFLSTCVGLLAAILVGSAPGIWLVGIPIVFGLCLVPAGRVAKGSPYKWLSKLSAGGLATVMSVMLFTSCILFIVAGEGIGDGKKWEYWLVKLLAVYLALLVSICLTSFWEEWVIWKLSGAKEAEFVFVKPVLRANLLVLLGIMMVAAAIMLPKRLKSPDFLVGPSAASKIRVIND